MLPTAVRNRLFHRVSERTLRGPRPLVPDDPLVARVYEQVGRDFVLAGPITVHAEAPTLLAGMWSFARETILVETAVDRPTKESVAAAVSRSNTCPYCVDMHVSMTHAGGRHEVANAIRVGAPESIADDRCRAMVQWSLATREPEADIVTSPPFSRTEAPEMVGTAVFFHYVNRVVNGLFEGTPLGPPLGIDRLGGPMLRLFGRELVDNVAHRAEAGTSIDLLPAAEHPIDAPWVRATPLIADALGRWVAAVEQQAAAVLSLAARELVADRIADWRGEPPPLGPAWLEAALVDVPAADAPGARLALLTAMASERIADADLAAARESVGDRGVLPILAWSAQRAALRIGSWLWEQADA